MFEGFQYPKLQKNLYKKKLKGIARSEKITISINSDIIKNI